MNLPLYADAKDGLKELNTHKGLWFERFLNRYNNQYDWNVEVTDKQNPKKDWIKEVAGKSGKCGSTDDLKRHALQQHQLCKNLNGKSQIYKNNWHFVTGMGNPHPVENGLIWHPTLGVPYLSGAAVKGIIRTWIEEWAGYEAAEIKQRSLKWFGSDQKDSIENQAGQFIFFDAIPVKEVILACDIMTPHMGKWYSNGGNIDQNNFAETVPADWHSPNIISFLVAKKITLQCCIAPRNKAAEGELKEVMEILTLALEYLGAGAKTATGYGRLKPDEKLQTELDKQIMLENRKTLSPVDAFKEELELLNNKQIAEMFGKNFNRTKKTYSENDWKKIIHILLTEKAALIAAWAIEDNKKSGAFKAYKKIKRYL